MFTFNSYPLFASGPQSNPTSISNQMKPNFHLGTQHKPSVSSAQITPPGGNQKAPGHSMDPFTMHGLMKSVQSSPPNLTNNTQFMNQTQQFLAHSMTPNRLGSSLASAVLLRSITQASQAAVANNPEHSRLFPLFMTHPGQTSPQFNDFSQSAANSMGGFLNPYSLLQEEPKPNHSYIGLIAMAILSSTEKKLVLSDIYQYILDNYPYFRSRGPGWRNSIRHNLSLNDCFIKAGRSANGKGHFWAIHPACQDDFAKGDFRRRHAQRKVRKAMGLAVADDESDGNRSPSPVAASGGQFSPIKFQFQSPKTGQENKKCDDSLRNPTIKAQKREHNEDENESLNSSISSDFSPMKIKAETSENEIENLKFTPPVKKRQKRSFNIESLLSHDSDTEQKTDDEHQNERM
ncbi:forkhead box protein L1-like [Symsagittifera roscoffensis]|uniref:forkhead box protein L1-like n=1 Tax=Symsagittifera roscoffensis TaxID=84072 RepID=UPI00307BDFCA